MRFQLFLLNQTKLFLKSISSTIIQAIKKFKKFPSSSSLILLYSVYKAYKQNLYYETKIQLGSFNPAEIFSVFKKLILLLF